MTVEYVVLLRQEHEVYVKCFYNGDGYGEFFLIINPTKGTIRFSPKDTYYAEVLLSAFRKTLTNWE